MTTHQAFYVAVEVDQDIRMSARMVGLGVEAGLAGAGFSGHITVSELTADRVEFRPDAQQEDTR